VSAELDRYSISCTPYREGALDGPVAVACALIPVRRPVRSGAGGGEGDASRRGDAHRAGHGQLVHHFQVDALGWGARHGAGSVAISTLETSNCAVLICGQSARPLWALIGPVCKQAFAGVRFVKSLAKGPFSLCYLYVRKTLR
jgi:hypothetical protein